MNFKNRFNEVLKITNKSQVQLAKECNITKQNITNYKTGFTVPSIDTLYLLCKSLDVSSDYLLGLSDNF